MSTYLLGCLGRSTSSVEGDSGSQIHRRTISLVSSSHPRSLSRMNNIPPHCTLVPWTSVTLSSGGLSTKMAVFYSLCHHKKSIACKRFSSPVQPYERCGRMALRMPSRIISEEWKSSSAPRLPTRRTNHIPCATSYLPRFLPATSHKLLIVGSCLSKSQSVLGSHLERL